MKKIFQKTFATVAAAATLTACLGGMTASAADKVVASDHEDCSPRGVVYGNISLSWYSPAGGVNIYTITASTSVCNVTGSYSLHTKLSLADYPSGTVRQTAPEGGSTAKLSGSYSSSHRARAYSTHEVRGSSAGVLYLASDVMNV